MKIAIIGGGPIGLMAAINLAKNGHLVDVFEKGEWPKDKACGQGIMPSGVKALKNNGIHFSSGKDSFSFNGVSYIDGQKYLKGFMGQVGIGVERKVLSKKLYERAHQFDEIRLNSGFTWLGLKEVGDKVHCQFKGVEDLVYDYVFACDGLHSPVRKFLNNEKVRRGPYRLGAREHFNIAPWSQQVEVYWQDGVEAYITPVSDTKIEVAFLWFEDAINPGVNENLRSFLFDKFPSLKKRLNFERSAHDFKGHGPFKKVSIRERVGRVFFLGDSYMFLDGITGEGLSLGFKGAELISQNFEKWNTLLHLRLRLFYLHYAFMVSVALSLSRSLRLRSIFLNTLRKNPKAFNIILRLNDF
ncbi:MAG: FAD-dependent monooxygenase [Bacteriovoracaceae bacterium]|nr:FAD-dependent monooxygenase [Bacteriovoracaceae bacterium]